MKKIIGPYGIFELLVSISMFCGLNYLTYQYFLDILSGARPTELTILLYVFIEINGLVIAALPLLSKMLEKVSNNEFRKFLDIPDKNSEFTFASVSVFLGDQALSSFLITLLVFTGKHVLQQYGGAIAGIYISSIFFVSIAIASVSLLRFIAHFLKYHWLLYSFAALMSATIMFAFFQVGIKLAP